jgi:AIPR protein
MIREETMSINVGIIDQRVRKLAEDLAGDLDAELGIKNDEDKKRSVAFVFLCVKTFLDLGDDEAFECLTEGGGDFGIDAIHMGDIEDGEFEFVVTLFQGKYKRDLTGDQNFPQNGVEKMIQAIRLLFDPNARISTNERLKAKIEEIRSLVRDGYIPRVRAVLCNNGLIWPATGQELIDRAGFSTEQVSWHYINPDELVRLQQSAKPVNETLRLTGKAFEENLDRIRVLIGKIPLREIELLFNRNGDRLLERNVRRFLGLLGRNRVNQAIAKTIQTAAERSKFYFYNNGLTLVCNKFDYNGLQREDWQVQVEGLQIINGGQTCKTIQTVLAELAGAAPGIENAFVLVRLYQLPLDSDDLVRTITYATNSQNPVDLRDLKSNDAIQRSLESAIQPLGYTYRRYRSEASLRPTDISSATAAEAILAVWRQKPHQAKALGQQHFGPLYDDIFTPETNGAQAVIATLLFRVAENKRRRPPPGAPNFLAYASYFMAMLMGRYLLADLGISLEQLDHRTFVQAKTKLEQNDDAYVARAVAEIQAGLHEIYGATQVSWQRMAATFRRGDLLTKLLPGAGDGD